MHRTLPLALLTLAACLPATPDDPTPPSGTAPELEVSIDGEVAESPVADFGIVAVGEIRVLPVIVRNAGDGMLRSLSLTVPDHPALEVTPSSLPWSLAPGAVVSLQLELRPTADESFFGELVVESDDPLHPSVVVSVVAETLGPIPSLRIAERPGDVVAGCEGAFELVLENVGRAGYVINDAVSLLGEERGAFVSLRGEALTWTLLPDEEARFDVLFAPETLGGKAVTVQATGASSEDEVSVILDATGTAGDAQNETFVQSDGALVDLLFVIGDSPGMDHSALLAGAQSLADGLDNLGLDWQIGAMSTDVAGLGALRTPSRWVHATDLDRVASIQAAFAVGTSGSEVEQGLHQAFLALSPPMTDGHNAGFVRDDSLLHLVFVTNEDDLSGPAAGWSATDYASFFEAQKEHPANVVATDITGGRTGCTGIRAASIADAYLDVTEATGGTSHSYCDSDWAPAFGAIAQTSRRRARRFPLSTDALDGSVAVMVSGLPETDWTFDVATGEVVFGLSSVPSPDALIEVSYTALGCR